MSKRKSGGAGANTSLNNTLFNYFAKSPASKFKTTSSTKEDAPETPKSTKEDAPRTPKSTKESPATKKESVILDDEDELIKTVSKKRLRIVDSDSDQENSSDNILESATKRQNKNSCDSPFTSRKKIKSQNDTEKFKSTPAKEHLMESTNDSDDENNSKDSVAAATSNLVSSFEEKLKSMQTDESIIATFDIEATENADDNILIENTDWRHNKLDFLKPNKIKDKNGKRSDDPDYDPTTLYVPTSYLETLTPAMRQWWEIKSQYYDTVLFFKVGKFYELYHMDADVGVAELGFTYMRGEFAHSGFPEQSYDRMASSLTVKGYKVARIEQTETPEGMQERVKQMVKPTKFDKVVRREVCQVTNRGTEVFGQQVHLKHDYEPNYMLAIAEKYSNKDNTSRFGVCFIDTSLCEFNIGEFTDDQLCSRLQTLLSHYPCVLVLSEKRGISEQTSKIFKTVLCDQLKEQLLPESQFWTAGKTLKILAEKYYNIDSRIEWPETLKLMQDNIDHLGLTPSKEYALALRAFGACLWYLQKCVIDEQIMSMAKFTLYIPPDDVSANEKISISRKPNRHMILDSITLNNLKIINSDISLLNTLDNCCTRFGQRLLHNWVCAPSCQKKVICGRQAAIQELMENNELLQNVRTILGVLPDLERLLSQIHTFGDAQRSKTHPDGRAVLFEQKTYNRKKIQDFVSSINGFDSLLSIPKLFRQCKSQLLKQLTQLDPNGMFPDMKDSLSYFKNGFNHDEALKEGIIAPSFGVDKEYDTVLGEIKSIEKDLAIYLKEQEKFFGCRITYFGSDRKRYQLEIPESNAKRADERYTVEGQRKAGSKSVKRFHTNETREFLKRMQQAEEERSTVLQDISRRMFEKFSKHSGQWKMCIDLIGSLDILTSLATYGLSLKDFCFPDILDFSEQPIVEFIESIHPCMKFSGEFIPNNITLGDGEAPLVLLTGPNMGGKSTLMRQVALLVIMSQIGCPIPAESGRISLVDRVFTRLGAQDDIMAGHSTFLVELNETSTALKHATRNSLILLDELGRGTSTYDGTAIAHAVVDFLANIQCRTLFSTHYHNLVDSFQEDKRISLGHMACMVENEDDDDPTQETVTFLYKYTSGPCPKSYGFNAAKLAGLNRDIIRRAYEFAKQTELSAWESKLFAKILRRAEMSEIKDLLKKVKQCSVK